MAGPDFLILGAQRSGTTWLHKNLLQHPNLWLTPIKELHYFDDPMRKKRYWRFVRRQFRETYLLSKWDRRFFLGGKPNDDWYASLFKDAQDRGQLAGEATPDYAVKPPDVFARLAKMNPAMKFIFIMRNPLDRCWSHFKNRHKKGLIGGTDEDAKIFCASQSCISRSSYIETIERLEQHFPAGQIHYCFFDDIQNDESGLVNSICSFLGVAELETELMPPVNAASRGTTMPSEVATIVAPLLVEPTARLADRFGGYAKNWAETLGTYI